MFKDKYEEDYNRVGPSSDVWVTYKALIYPTLSFSTHYRLGS